MQAVGFHQPGEPEVLEVVDLPTPSPGTGEVLIRVHAASVNPTDTMLRVRGRKDEPELRVPGMDAAGVVEEFGDGVETDLRVGDPVMAVVAPTGAHGAYAELIAMPIESVARAPRGFDHQQAATLPMNGLTARLALDTLGLEKGSVLAVTGAAGTMGGYAVQLAKKDGLTVIADAKEADEDRVIGFGADLVLSRGDDFPQLIRERYPEGVDGVIDGALMHEKIAPAVCDGGTVITVRGYEEPGERGITFTPIWVVDYAREHEKLDELRQAAENGTVTLQVAETYSKDQAPAAHRRLEAGRVRGRLVLTF